MEYLSISFERAIAYAERVVAAGILPRHSAFLGLHGSLFCEEGTGKGKRDADFIVYIDTDSFSFNLDLNSFANGLMATAGAIPRYSYSIFEDEFVGSNFEWDRRLVSFHFVRIPFLFEKTRIRNLESTYMEDSLFISRLKAQTVYRLWIRDVCPIWEPTGFYQELKEISQDVIIWDSLLERRLFNLDESLHHLKSSVREGNDGYMYASGAAVFNEFVFAIYHKNQEFFATPKYIDLDIRKLLGDEGFKQFSRISKGLSTTQGPDVVSRVNRFLGEYIDPFNKL